MPNILSTTTYPKVKKKSLMFTRNATLESFQKNENKGKIFGVKIYDPIKRDGF